MIGQSALVSNLPDALDLTRVTTVATALDDAPTRDRGWSIYVPLGSQTLDPTTKCLWVFDLWEDVEAAAADAGWRPGLTASEIRQVRDNLGLQVEAFDSAQLVAAADHYFRHDAFIDLAPQ